MQWLSTPHAPHPPPSLLWHQLNTESGHAERFALSSSWYNFSQQASLVFLQFILHTLTIDWLIDWLGFFSHLTAADNVMNWIIILGILFYISFIYVCREQAPSSITVIKNMPHSMHLWMKFKCTGLGGFFLPNPLPLRAFVF